MTDPNITNLDKTMYLDGLAKRRLTENAEIGQDSSSKFSYVKMNDKSHPAGFDTQKLNAMKFTKRMVSRKSFKRNSHQARTVANDMKSYFSGSKRTNVEMSIEDSDSENSNSGESLDILKRRRSNPKIFRSHVV